MSQQFQTLRRPALRRRLVTVAAAGSCRIAAGNPALKAVLAAPPLAVLFSVTPGGVSPGVTTGVSHTPNRSNWHMSEEEAGQFIRRYVHW